MTAEPVDKLIAASGDLGRSSTFSRPSPGA